MDNLSKRRKQRKKKKRLLIISLIMIICSIGVIFIYNNYNIKRTSRLTEEKLKAEKNSKEEEIQKEKEQEELLKKEITISFAGDCTLGTDTNFGYNYSLPAMVDKNNKDYSTLMKNVYSIFSKDDYTLVNLETALTDNNVKRDKGEPPVFHFKGPQEYAKILSTSSIEGVTVSNNHIYDYGETGFKDTIAALEKENIDYTGEGYKIIKDIKGIKFAFLGYQGWYIDENVKKNIKNDFKEMRDKGADVIIPYFHWGIEREYTPESTQRELAHFAIDEGADMVLGTHPHVIQSLESYKDRLIAYSLGNFCFGGNSNPNDKRALIVQVRFNFKDNELNKTSYKVIPTRISSVTSHNDYVPTPMKGKEGTDLLKYLESISINFTAELKKDFFQLK